MLSSLLSLSRSTRREEIQRISTNKGGMWCFNPVDCAAEMHSADALSVIHQLYCAAQLIFVQVDVAHGGVEVFVAGKGLDNTCVDAFVS